MGSSTKPFQKGNIKLLKLVTCIRAAGKGSLIINDLLCFYLLRGQFHKKHFFTSLDALITNTAVILLTSLLRQKGELFVSKEPIKEKVSKH